MVLPTALTVTPIAMNPQAGKWRTEAMRSHTTPRLIIFSKGQGRITISGLTRGFGPNNMVFIPAGTMYGYECGPTVFGQMIAIPAAMAAEWPDAAVHLRLREVHAQKDMMQCLDNLEKELANDREGHSRAAHYHLGLLAVFFERQRLAADSADWTNTAASRLVAAYTDLVERDYRSKKSVADYAASLGVTPTHLTRCCRQTCGRSALKLLNDRVLYEARLELREGKLPIQDIAKGLGFTSAAYFTRAFQSATGLTPSRFRKHGSRTEI